MKFKIIPNEQTPRRLKVKIPITEFININYKLMNKFLSFVRMQHNCIGLASNQVSCDGERIMHPFFAIKHNHQWDVMIDPYIIKLVGKSEETVERCLTWIGKDIIAKRHHTVLVQYYNLKGDLIQETMKGIKAQVFQHEYSHLMGYKEKIK